MKNLDLNQLLSSTTTAHMAHQVNHKIWRVAMAHALALPVTRIYTAVSGTLTCSSTESLVSAKRSDLIGVMVITSQRPSPSREKPMPPSL
jgi:hypothetical protein